MTPEPSLPQPHWRPASPADLAAMRRLADACRAADGDIAPGAQDSLAALLNGQEPSEALCAVQDDGSLLAFGWLVPRPELAQPYCALHCLVDPAWRAGQLHEALLRWGSSALHSALLAGPPGARRSCASSCSTLTTNLRGCICPTAWSCPLPRT